MIVEHGKSGWLFSAGDAQALADSIVQIATDPDLRNRLAKAAVPRADNFNPATMIERTLAFYREVLDGGWNARQRSVAPRRFVIVMPSARLVATNPRVR